MNYRKVIFDMANKLDELLTKMPKIFKRDAYVINHRYLVGGDESEKLNAGVYTCLLTEDYSNSIKEVFDDNILYISDVRKSKSDKCTYISSTYDEALLKKAQENIKLVENEVNSFNSWKELKIYDTDGSCIFDDDYIINIPGESKDIVISKEMFPLTSKTLSPIISYNTKEDKESGILTLVILMDLPYFQIHAVYKYVII